MSIGNHAPKVIDFLRLPRPQGERRKSIYSPWGRGQKIDFQAMSFYIFMIPDSHNILFAINNEILRSHNPANIQN
jgi:hypothetical protein